MKWNLDYELCKIITLTDLISKTIKIWKNVKINSSFQKNYMLSQWIEIGDNVFLNWLNGFYSSKDNRIIIGKYCSIAVGATFIEDMRHNYQHMYENFLKLILKTYDEQ